MNLLLARPGEIQADGRLELRGRRLAHLHEVLGSAPGDILRVGELHGHVGTAVVEELTSEHALLRASLSDDPPPALPVTVVLALPRPKMLRRIFRSLGELGVKDIHLIHSYRVEKSFWQSPLLHTERRDEALISGLEQAMDTVLPTVTEHRRFRPFAEDVLPGLCAGREALLGAPRAREPYPETPGVPALLAIGPEGGFIPFEEELIVRAGARPVSLGPRILRVETALQATLGRHLAKT